MYSGEDADVWVGAGYKWVESRGGMLDQDQVQCVRGVGGGELRVGREGGGIGRRGRSGRGTKSINAYKRAEQHIHLYTPNENKKTVFSVGIHCK